jgi:hypothetical protein
VTNNGDLLVLLPVLPQQLLDLPRPRPEFLRRLVDHLRLQQMQQFILLLGEGQLSLALEMQADGVLEVVAQDFNKPEFGVVLHEAEVVVREGLRFVVHVAADVAGEPEDLGQQGVHFHPHLPLSEDLTAGLKRPEVRRDQHHVDGLTAERLPGRPALLPPFLRDSAVDVFSGVGDCVVELLDLDALIPGEGGDVVDFLEAEVPLVEVGLRVADEDELLAGLLCFLHHIIRVDRIV